MNLLLDTHAFYWWAIEPDKLSEPARAALADPANAVFLSVACLWEMVIKSEVKRLRLDDPLDALVEAQCRQNGFRLLPIELRHVYALRGLPYHHKDPFDRILMSQSIADGLTLVTTDRLFADYPVVTLW